MNEKLQNIADSFNRDLSSITDAAGLENVRVKYLGRKGLVGELFKDMSGLSNEEKPAFGKLINDLKNDLQSQLEAAAGSFSGQARSQGSVGPEVDITLPGTGTVLGKKHPLTIVFEEICDLFIEMGFCVVEGPEIETEYYNFEALNIPMEHPSRESFDTFYVQNKYLLRSHTSPVQVRYMEKHKPPVQIVVPGKVYRPDATDASHSFMFNQIEGLLVDQGITLAHLKGVLSVFAKKLFGPKTKTRFRPHFFPFTEPSAEMDVSCTTCFGKGCRVCSNKGWLEILGSGMVHPKVLSACDIDSRKYSGFAFGMGVERIAMLKYGIDDIRLFYENDLRFTRQFE